MREIDIAAAVCAWLSERGWTVYQEVQIEPDGPCADIVATHDAGDVWIVECKRTVTVALLGQAVGWWRYAQFRSVAIEDGHRTYYGDRVANNLGLGVFVVDGKGAHSMLEAPRASAALLCGEMVRALRPEQQTYAPAGTASGKRFTPEMAALSDLAALVTREGEVSLKAAVGKIRHPWPTSARAESELRRLLRKGQVDGVRLRRVRGRDVLRAEEGTF